MTQVYKYLNKSPTQTIVVGSYTILPYHAFYSNEPVPELERLDGTLLDKYLNGEARQDPAVFNYYQPVISSEKGDGIKLNIDNPQYGWHDLLSPTTPYSGPATYTPSFEDMVTDLPRYRFKVNDRSYHEFHIPHDYAPGTDLYIHVHWVLNTAPSLGGTTTWEFGTTYAKGYSQQSFNQLKYLSVSQVASITPLVHHIAEVKLSVSGGSASQLDSIDIETDGLILVRTKLHANTCGSDPFMLFCDLHYQSTNLATKNKNYNFWQ